MRLSHVPLRLAAGAFILNAGVSHLGMDSDTAKGVHGMASRAYPPLTRVDPQPFGQALAAGEIALGAALLIPVIPSGLAGLALAGFSGSLLGMYVRTPALHQEGSLRPNTEGTAIAKDSWLAGIAAALIIDQVVGSRSKRARSRVQAKLGELEERLETQRTEYETQRSELDAERVSLQESLAAAQRTAKEAQRGPAFTERTRERGRQTRRNARLARKGLALGSTVAHTAYNVGAARGALGARGAQAVGRVRAAIPGSDS